jgi:oligopeptide transport system substrate-binding protein
MPVESISWRIRTERQTHLPWLILTLLLVAACAPPESNVSLGNRTGVLYYGIGSEVQTIDPHVLSDTGAYEVAGALFEGLIRHNPETLEPEPGVAESWEVSDDGLTLTFQLNPRAKWSNGDPVTAEDFVWSWRRSLHPAMGNILAEYMYPIRNAEPYSKGLIDDPDELGVHALDRHTLQVQLENPTPHIFLLLDTPYAAPVHRATIEAHGKSTDRYTRWTRPQNIVNNGPFNLTEWKIYRYLRVERSDTYWDADNVGLKAIMFKPIDSDTVEEKMFRAGQLHVTFRLPVNKIPGYKVLAGSPYVEAPLLGSYYYLFNIDKTPVHDINLRKALAMAIDRDQLVNKVLLGTERASASIVPMGIPGYATQHHATFDPERARELLAAAGFPDGAGWPGLELVYNTNENHRRIAVAVQQMWKEHLNIEVELTNQEWKVYLDTVDNKQFRLARMGWIGSFLDPGTFLNRFTTHGTSNRTGYSDPRYDEIIEQLAPAALTRDRRFELMAEAESLFMQQYAIIPLYSYNGKHLVQPSVQGYHPNILEYRNFKQVSLDPGVGVWQWPNED